MNTPDDESGDELTRAYRNASDAQAGGPAASTRAAIFAAARAASLRRTPAANESRYVWRAAAGIAVLGVAVILWRQTDQGLKHDLAAVPENAPAAVQAPAAAPQPAADVAPAADAGKMADKRTATMRTAAESAEKDEREVPLKAAPERPREEASGSSAATAEVLPPPVQLASATANAVAPMRAEGAMQAAGGIRKDSANHPLVNYQQLVQREFPGVWNGAEPANTVWVVLDANGKVLRKGELVPGATVTADQPFETNRPWLMVPVTTASGRSLQLAVLRD